MLPGPGADAICVQAGGREDGELRAAGWARGLVGADRVNWNVTQAGLGEDFFGEVEPGADAFVGDVDDASSVLADQVADGAG